MSVDSKKRFSSRVANYVKYRPTYPAEVIDMLKREAGLKKQWGVADIGAGTGISARLFLENGNTVWCVEPNKEMRQASEQLLGEYAGFRSVDGSAEETGLAAGSVDLIVSAQAFHWFDRQKAKREFVRILKSDGVAVLMWNARKESGSVFAEEYEKLLDGAATDYQRIKHQNISDQELDDWFGEKMNKRVFGNSQKLDWDGLKGRALSSSYVPQEGEAGHREFEEGLRRVFQEANVGGVVEMDYETEVYWGQLQA